MSVSSAENPISMLHKDIYLVFLDFVRLRYWRLSDADFNRYTREVYHEMKRVATGANRERMRRRYALTRKLMQEHQMKQQTEKPDSPERFHYD